MKNVYKLFIFFLSLMVLSGSSIIAHESAEILKLCEQYRAWQKVLDKQTIARGKRVFHIWSGENYKNEKWVAEVAKKNGDYFIGEEVNLIRNDKLGIMFYLLETSPSGDWNIAGEHYYRPSGELFFVFWRLNTFQALEPLTIERRLFFDKHGKLLQLSEDVYKLGTKEKVVAPGYMSRNVTYWKNIKELPFYSVAFR